ncbi:MAG: BMP family ABC transporter substrate-binding protein [Meiothermus sp.]|uniref:BMP family ABC transporter substrate-binding protein n=1 Tax=Meiothermus sp. TaxID=1955249 RepID=UPI0025CCAA19|nr:BMP family ABC transporter substrate-binding protein [Meiothermus sp.]MCS7057335.1 BMP family ABC transporter substrate-binding protein [Meiothermus sp.]MCS7194443.1 BMP family ABC transporter substrate-binding protein [Meiothermus sp.]MCX7741623.1 BMP family ABC transporter substrate-binding protein [Meiothermus sp.]MDW8091077.1 BMP family ABC transporter substrate-binding protein [Meiothermus sp.]MDW8481388.1 BMP family ABC transporter substrate-binding protein [Meiothermus sp.]
MKIRLLALLVALGLGLGLAQQSNLKACFIYVGPIGDVGWTYAHDEGRRAAEKAIPGLTTQYVESVKPADTLATVDRLVAGGCNVIFTTSFDFMDQTLEAAKKYPNVIFAHASGFKRAPNMLTYMADFYQIYYLNGLMAGALTKSGKVGYVAAFPIPELKRHISAFALGVRAVNPRATVNVKWINAWYSPVKAREATEALIAEGNDIVAFTEDTATVIQTAARRRVPSFSHYNSMYKYAPDYVVSGQLVDWSVIYIDILKKVQNGTYTPKNLENVDYWWLARERAVMLGAQVGMPINPKFEPALKQATMVVNGKRMSVYDRVMELYRDIQSPNPKWDPFTGPIRDRNGVLRVPAGRRMTVKELNEMQWVAPGVVGPVPDEPK